MSDPATPDPRPPLLPGQLTDGWRWLLAVSWALTVPALIALGDASHAFGKPVWWLDRDSTAAWWSVFAFVPPTVAALAAALNHRRWRWAAAFGVAALVAGAIVDLGRSPAVALGEFGLTAGAVAASVAALAGCAR